MKFKNFGKFKNFRSWSESKTLLSPHTVVSFSEKGTNSLVNGRLVTTMPRKKKSDGWQYSDGKAILIAKLKSGEIPISGGDVATIYAMDPAFGGTDPEQFRLFAPRLKGARKLVADGIRRSASEAAALESDREKYPPSEFNQRNVPRWQGSDAEVLLKADVASNKILQMKPQELHLTQAEYQKFPLCVFREHIYQEVKLQKFRLQYGNRNNVPT